MKPALRYTIMFLALGAALLSGYGLWRAATPPVRLENQAYVWQTRWNDDVLAAVDRAAPVMDGFMALMGEVNHDGSDFSFTLARPNPGAVKKPFTLVLRARVGLAKALSAGRTEEAAAYIAGILRPLLQAAPAGNPPGVQLDYDCPTGRLAEYTALLQALRRACPGITPSITALPDWLNSKAFPELAAQAAYYVLQVHSLQPPKTDKDAHVLCDLEKTRGYARRAARLGKPFYIALPTYTYRLFFDRTGAFRAIAAEQDAGPPPPGWHARATAADPAGIAGLVRDWRARPPRHCLGLVWFRLPVDTDRLNLPWTAFQAVMRGEAPKTALAAEMRRPSPGLYELWLRNAGEYTPAADMRCTIQWRKDTLLTYDVLGGYKGTSAPGKDTLDIQGPAPAKSADPALIAWFRVRPEFNEGKEIIQCGPLSIQY